MTGSEGGLRCSSSDGRQGTYKVARAARRAHSASRSAAAAAAHAQRMRSGDIGARLSGSPCLAVFPLPYAHACR